MRATATIEVGAPPELVWQWIGDPARYLHFWSGITRWEVVSDTPTGLGARYRTLMRVRSAEVGGLVEVVEWTEPTDIAWSAITGVDQRGRWRVRERGRARTEVELRLSGGVAGSGPIGWLAEKLAEPVIEDHLRRTLQALKRQVEHEQLRARAAARRKARATSVSS